MSMTVKKFIQLLLLCISPLIIILLFVGLITFIESYSEHNNNIDELLKTGSKYTAVSAKYLNEYKTSISYLTDCIIIIIVSVIYLDIEPRFMLLGTESWSAFVKRSN